MDMSSDGTTFLRGENSIMIRPNTESLELVMEEKKHFK